MLLQPSQIVADPTKPIVLTKVQRLAAIMALNYTGINVQRTSSKDDA